jgi:hypothetical protein
MIVLGSVLLRYTLFASWFFSEAFTELHSFDLKARSLEAM